MRYDVVILGGGPAGTAAALSLRKQSPGLSVAIIEASNYDRLRIGETLTPVAQALLEQLGIWDEFLNERHIAAYGTRSVWGSDELLDNEFIYHPYGRGWHLDRARFDSMLARQAESRGAKVYTGALVTGSHKTNGGLWQITAETADKQRINLEASFVIDATGRRVAFATRQGARRVLFDQLLGVFVFFRMDAGASATDTYTLVEAWEEGWWYSALLPENRMVFACMTDVDIVRKHGLKSASCWLECLNNSPHTRARAVHGRPEYRPRIYPAYSHRLDCLTGGGWLAAGDAATTVDPLSSQGIFKALRSGILASFAVCDYFKGERAGLEKYEEIIAGEFENYLATRMDYYGRERRWEASPFWQRRHSRITLDPRQAIHFQSAETDARIEKLSMHLPVSDLKLLCDLCVAPRPAHEVVSEFKRASKNPATDLRIIQALQYLIERGIIESES